MVPPSLVAGRMSRAALALLVVIFFFLALPAAYASPAVAAQFSGAMATLGGGFNSPFGVAVDASGNAYVADIFNNAIDEIPSGCTSASCVKTLGGGFNRPYGVAVDANGNVYVADLGNHAVKEIPASCISGANNSSCVKTLGGGFQAPSDVAVTASGNIYVADQAKSSLIEIPASCISGANNSGCVETLGGGLLQATALALDTNGDIYVADQDANAVKIVPPTCTNLSCVTTVGGFNYPTGIAFDSSGNAYVANSDNGELKEIPAGCTQSSCVETLASGINGISGVAVGNKDNFYISQNSNVGVLMRHAEFFPEQVGKTSGVEALQYTFTSGGTIGAPVALTMGAKNLDFKTTGTGTCTTNGVSHVYSAGDSCTVDVTFTPRYPGLRKGAVELVNSSGTPIATAYAYGTGSGSEVAFSPAKVSTVFSDSSAYVAGVAVDGSGNVYYGDYSNNVVDEVPAGCSSASCAKTLGGSWSYPWGVAVDGAGNVYVGNDSGEPVLEIPKSCIAGANDASCEIQLGGAGDPTGVAVDGAGNVYTAGWDGNDVQEIPAGCTTALDKAGSCKVTTLGGGFNLPITVAVDGSGNVYVADSGNSAVKEIPAGCTAALYKAGSCKVTTLGGSFSDPYTVALDGRGNVYVGDDITGELYEIPAGCTAALYQAGSCKVMKLGSDSAAFGLAMDGAGSIYYSTSGKDPIQEIARGTPPSLSFASTDVGATSTDSPQTVTVENTGNTTLTFPIPTISGAYNPSVPANFSYDNTSTCVQNGSSASTAFTLASGKSCTVAINFKPTVAGSISGNVKVTTATLTGGNTTLSIPVSGTGIQTVNHFTFTTAPPSSTTAGKSFTVKVTAYSSTDSSKVMTSYAGPVTLSSTDASATFSSVSWSSGVGTFTATLKTAGTQTITVAAQGGAISKTSSNVSVAAAAAETIKAITGGGQSAVIGAAFTNPLKVEVLDQYSNPVGGATVTFTAPTAGASAKLSSTTCTTSTSSPVGYCTVTVTANGTASSTTYDVKAAVKGVSTPASFSLTNKQAQTTLKVTPSAITLAYGQPVTVTAAISPATAGSSSPSGDVTFYDGATALSPNETVSNATASYTVSVPMVGSHTYKAKYLGGTDFAASAETSATSTVTVSKATSTLTGPATQPVMVVNGQMGSIPVTVTGQYSGQGIATPSGSVHYAINGTAYSGTETISNGVATIPVPDTLSSGNYSVAVTYGGDSHYQAASGVNISLQIGKLTPTVTYPAPGTMIYGTGLGPDLDATTAEGTTNLTPDGTTTYTATPAGGSPMAVTSATVLPAGTYTLIATWTPSGSYTTTYKPASQTTMLAVSKAALTVTAGNATRTYGTANPAFTGNVRGAVNGDTFTESFSTTATTTSRAGTYPIVPSAAGTDLSDYTVSKTDGTLTVKKAGSSVALTSSTKNANLNADVTFTAVVTSATTGTPSGSVEFMDGTKELGTSTLNGTGSATYTTSKLTAGLHQITAVYSGNGNFDGSTSAALAEIVTAPNYSLTSNPSSLTLKAGQTGKATISLVPVGGFKGTVQLSCNGLPSEAHCTFSPSALTADGSNTTETSTLTITTVGPYSGTVGSVAMLHPGNPDGEMLAGIFWLPGLLFGLFLMWQRKRLTTKYRVLVLMLLVATTLSGMVGCGFQQPYTAPGTKMVTVTASASGSGSLSHKVTIDIKITH